MGLLPCLRQHRLISLQPCMAGSMGCLDLDLVAKASSFGGPVAVMAGILFSSKVALLPGICLGHCAWPMKCNPALQAPYLR